MSDPSCGGTILKKDPNMQANSTHEPIKSLSQAVRERYQRNVYDRIQEFAMPKFQREQEKILLKCIESGDVSALDRLLAAFEENSQDPTLLSGTQLSLSALAQSRYAMVASITLFCRAAIDGGLPETLAYEISDSYIRQLDALGDPAEINLLFPSAAKEYCHVMRDWQLVDCRLEIRKCYEYVCLHIHDRIALKDLSEIAHLSQSRLSDLFVLELGLRPSAFIRQQKLKYACTILEHFNTPVTYIANLLAFPSPSAFASQFKAAYEITPLAYRRKMQKIWH